MRKVGLYAGAGSFRGWGVKYTVFAEDHPWINEQKRLVRDLRSERDGAVSAFLGGLMAPPGSPGAPVPPVAPAPGGE